MTDKTEAAQAKLNKQLLAALDALGAQTVQDDTLTFEGDRFVIPAGMTAGDAAKFLKDWERNQEEEFEFRREFPYRPYDGAAAFDRACKRVFGSSGMGKATFSFFGKNPPEFVSIAVGLNRTAQVPWGSVEMPAIEAQFYLGATRDRELGIVFVLAVTAPRKNRRRIEAFFDVVADELAQRSIYRGQAITGGEEPLFLDLSGVDESKVVYSADTLTQLNANLWSLIEHADTMRELGIPLKRAVLNEGPWGTGKTLVGALTGQRAVANHWTYILARPGQDDLLATMRTARMYAPAVVWFEDIDVSASNATSTYISQLLDALDGVSAKGSEVIVGFTTNYVEKIAKGMLRPGRIDSVIHFGPLQSEDVERLVRVVVPARLVSDNIDWSKVADAFTGYVPAFAKEAIDRAMRYTIARTGTVGPLSTNDLVSAAQGLRAQLSLMEEADDGVRGDSLDRELVRLVEGVVERSRVTFTGDGEVAYHLAVEDS